MALVIAFPALGQAVQTFPELFQFPNDTTYGTVTDHLVKLTAAGQVTILSRTDTGGAIGLVRSGSGRSGVAGIAILGQSGCAFDGPAIYGDYVQISSTIAGDCHDAGSSYPGSGQVLGRVVQTTSAASTSSVFLIPEVKPAGASVGSNAGSLLGVPLSNTALLQGQGYMFDSLSGSLVPVALPYWKKFTLAYSQLTPITGNTASIVMFARPARRRVCGVSMFITAGFSAPGLSAITLTVGDSNGTPDLYTQVPASLIDNASPNYTVLGSAAGSGTINANVTSTNATLSALTAGSVDLDICLVDLP